MINQNLKILHTASFFLAELTVSTLLFYSLFLLRTSSYCIKKSTFTTLLWLASHFTDRANTHTYPIFCLFCFMVQSSRAIDKNEVLLTTTYHLLQWLSKIILQGSLARFCSVSLPNQNEFNRQNKRNGHYRFCVLYRIIIKQYHT